MDMEVPPREVVRHPVCPPDSHRGSPLRHDISDRRV